MAYGVLVPAQEVSPSKGSFPSFEALHGAFPVLEACFNESLRILPPVSKLLRSVLMDCSGLDPDGDQLDFNLLHAKHSTRHFANVQRALIPQAYNHHDCAPAIALREATEDMTLAGTGVKVPSGTKFEVSLYCAMREPDVWTEPLEFHPERFLPGQHLALIDFGQRGKQPSPSQTLSTYCSTSVSSKQCLTGS